MKKALWILPAVLALALVGCELINTETGELIYEVVFYDESGVEKKRGQMELEYSNPTRDSDLRSIDGRWKLDPPYGGIDSGSLIGGLGKNGDVWIDFQLYLHATDIGLELKGRFVSGTSGDLEGHVVRMGYGTYNSDWTFRAVLK